MSVSSDGAPLMIERRERAMRALALRKAGWTFAQIATQLDYSNATSARESIFRLIRWSMKESPLVEEMREMESQRLDHLLTKWWQRAGTDERSARLVLEVIRTRAQLFGLNRNEARIAGAMEATAVADLAKVSMLHAHLMGAMSEIGMDPDDQDRLIAALNRRMGDPSQTHPTSKEKHMPSEQEIADVLERHPDVRSLAEAQITTEADLTEAHAQASAALNAAAQYTDQLAACEWCKIGFHGHGEQGCADCEECRKSAAGDLARNGQLDAAIQITALRVIARCAEDAEWADWPEIGEDDWGRVQDRVAFLAGQIRPEEKSIYLMAYGVLESAPTTGKGKMIMNIDTTELLS